MHLRNWLAIPLVLLAALGAAPAARVPSGRLAQADEVRALDGEWIYVEDRTEGRALEDHGPPMSPRLRLRVDEDALVWLRSGGREERMALDGSTLEVPEGETIRRYTGVWNDGLFAYENETVRASDGARLGLLRKAFEVVPDGMLVHVAIDPPDGYRSVALYRHPEDIELPERAEAAIDDVAWLAGAWVGTTSKSSIEERWSPPGAGAMLGVSRTIRGDKMVGFEFLRVVERDGGLVYVAQPGGNPPTTFVLTELDGTRAVFENPRHDSPQRIVYELVAEDSLRASIGFVHGGRPRSFEFTRAGNGYEK